MKRIVNETKLTFEQAVETAVDKIARRTGAFVLDTKFGKIPVEIGSFSEPVCVEKWDECSPTKFVIKNRSKKYKYVVRISAKFLKFKINKLQLEVKTDDNFLRCNVAWALAVIMLHEFSGGLFGLHGSRYVDAILLTYMREYLGYDNIFYTVHAVASVYIDNVNPFARISSRNYRMLENSVVNNIKSRVKTADDVIIAAMDKFYNGYTINALDYGNKFYDIIMAICLDADGGSWFDRTKHYCPLIQDSIDDNTTSIATIHGLDIIREIFKKENFK